MLYALTALEAGQIAVDKKVLSVASGRTDGNVFGEILPTHDYAEHFRIPQARVTGRLIVQPM